MMVSGNNQMEKSTSRRQSYRDRRQIKLFLPSFLGREDVCNLNDMTGTFEV